MPAERRSLLSKNASSKISTICNYKFSYFLCNVAASTVHHQHAKNLKLKHRRTKNAIKSNSCHKFSILRFTFFALIFFFLLCTLFSLVVLQAVGCRIAQIQWTVVLKLQRTNTNTLFPFRSCSMSISLSRQCI